jgi:molybdopterin-guanine dinucleotide biosynthesis protein A
MGRPGPVVGVLAGGHSRRLGRDKAALQVAGEPLLARTVRLARAAGLEVAVSGRTAGQVDGIVGGPAGPLLCLPDEEPGLGPLGGILTLLRVLDRPVLAVAVDLPRLSVEALAWLAGEGRLGLYADGLGVRDGEGILQPLFSIYTPLVLPLAERLLADGRRAPREVLMAGRFRLVTLPERFHDELTGIDTPADLERLDSVP